MKAWPSWGSDEGMGTVIRQLHGLTHAARRTCTESSTSAAELFALENEDEEEEEDGGLFSDEEDDGGAASAQDLFAPKAPVQVGVTLSLVPTTFDDQCATLISYYAKHDATKTQHQIEEIVCSNPRLPMKPATFGQLGGKLQSKYKLELAEGATLWQEVQQKSTALTDPAPADYDGQVALLSEFYATHDPSKTKVQIAGIVCSNPKKPRKASSWRQLVAKLEAKYGEAVLMPGEEQVAALDGSEAAQANAPAEGAPQLQPADGAQQAAKSKKKMSMAQAMLAASAGQADVVSCQFAGKGKWVRVVMQLQGENLSMTEVSEYTPAHIDAAAMEAAIERLAEKRGAAPAVCRACITGCKVGDSKSKRKGHPHLFRVDLAEADNGGGLKYSHSRVASAQFFRHN
jgi:hypothetical protein